MFHHHHHHGPDDHGHHDHGHGHDEPHAAARDTRVARLARFGLALALLLVAIGAACSVVVERGEAVVVTRFGDPVRVLATPGLALKAPPPFETVSRVDLRLHSLSSGLQDVGTKDGLRVLVQAYVLWRVGTEADQVRLFLRAVRNEPDTAAAQIRSFTASVMEIAASQFDLAALVDTDRSKLRLADLEALMRDKLRAQLGPAYGVVVEQVGIERLALPTETMEATISRMSAERLTAARQRKAEGNRVAAEIRSDADRDSRIALAQAKAEAAETEAKARLAASAIYGASYRANPDLFTLLRSLDTLNQVVGDNTRLILRTDAAPFRALVEKPGDGKPGNGKPGDGKPGDLDPTPAPATPLEPRR